MSSNSNQRGAIPEEDREKYEVSTWDVLGAMAKDLGKYAISFTPGYESAKKLKQKSPKYDRKRRNR